MHSFPILLDFSKNNNTNSSSFRVSGVVTLVKMFSCNRRNCDLPVLLHSCVKWRNVPNNVQKSTSESAQFNRRYHRCKAHVRKLTSNCSIFSYESLERLFMGHCVARWFAGGLTNIEAHRSDIPMKVNVHLFDPTHHLDVSCKHVSAKIMFIE